MSIVCRRSSRPSLLFPVLFALVTAAYAQDGWVTVETTELNADDAAADDGFGASAAISGSTILIGAPNETSVATQNGAAYVFVASGTSWTQQAKLKATDATADDRFGLSVAVQGDRAVIGAPQIGAGQGAVYVFERTGTSWSQTRKLEAMDGAFDDDFGVSVALDGNTVAVGAPLDDDDGSASGAVYVFTGSGTSWTLQEKLVAGDAAANQAFGWSVALEGDRLAIGALGGLPGASGIGSAYVFQRGLFGWSQSAKVGASDPGSGDEFGLSLSLSGDTLLVGAGAGDDGAADSGSAYVFEGGPFGWSQTQKLLPSGPGANLHFGRSVRLSGDLALIGAPHDFTYFGSAYLFVNDGGWVQEDRLFASDGTASDFFGYVALEGETAAVGATRGDSAVLDSGSAYVFDLRGPNGADACADALPIEGDGKFPFDNRGATTDGPVETGCDFLGNLAHKDLWWCWTSPCTGKVTVQTCFGTDLDDALVVYDGCACPPLARLGCEEAGCGTTGFQSGVTFDAVAGNVYKIRLGSYDPGAGGYGDFEIVLDAECTDCPLGLASRYSGSSDTWAAARRLTTLYRLRTRFLEDPVADPRWVDLYARHAPRLARIVGERPGLLRRLAALVAVVQPGLDALGRDDARAAELRVPPRAVALLASVLDELEEADADGPLARAVCEQRVALELSRLAGASYADVWERVCAGPVKRP